MTKNTLSKEEMIARLKELSATTIRNEMFTSAMCYSRVMPPAKHAKCDRCGADIEYVDWGGDRDRDAVYKTVRDIAGLGYDAKVETCCMKCAEKLMEELHLDAGARQDEDCSGYATANLDDINYLFSFKPKDGDNYHVCIANSVKQYKSLHAFLCNKTSYRDYDDFVYYVADEKDVLKYMTGIDFDAQD